MVDKQINADGLLYNFVAAVHSLALEFDRDAWWQLTERFRPQLMSRVVSAAIRKTHGVESVPVYSSADARDTEYRAGSREALVAVLRNLRVVDEDRTSWEQVCEFRRDREALRKYRRLIHWLDTDMVGRSLSYLEQEISNRIDDYEWSIQKHGFATKIGLIGSIADPRTLAAAATTYAALSLSTSPIAGIVGGTLAVAGAVSLSAALSLLNVEDAKRGPNACVAFVHEARKSLMPATTA